MIISSGQLSSSVLSRAYYDLERETLRLEFATGLTYEYIQVPYSVYAGLVEAQSAGKFLNKVIKPYFEGKLLNVTA